ncbi:DEAD/DEAH box helicase [Aquicoccus sp. SU-CL01552]|uniref:DEAD/DEAH box helicase n=1 Tax=Aquicoccus sp. SU-CL01552 TaxID=3127656 RepID=UPI003109BA48
MTKPLLDALAARGYDTLTDVQTAVTAAEYAQSDLLVSAQTGSGKTVGFGLAIAPTLLGEADILPRAAAPLALVVAPTRELALQVQRELAWLYEKTQAQVVSCIGGMDPRSERRTLDRGAHIVVGTPGRLRDHIERGALDLSSLRAVVLDEADEMLDLGFREDLEFMLGAAPSDRRTLLFSATVSKPIADLATNYQRDAVRITTLTGGKQHTDIEYRAIQVAQKDVEHAIINLLRLHDAQTAIVFANTRAAVARLTARFSNRGFAVVSISGELSQDERSHALQALRDGRARVCVATDVAARGIDLPNLELVVHADLPTNTEGLLHRSGRTGRAGRKGTAALIVPDKAVRKAERLLKWAKIEATWGFAPTPEEIREKDEARLLADPVWTDPATDEETAFANRVLAGFTPEQIAIACQRLYLGGRSAPEELGAPPTRAADRAPRVEFGPSAWIKLSIGRDRNAEPRWLLPLLCRAGNLDKSQIGKIRVSDSESFVELSESAVAGFFDQLGPDNVLEDDVTAAAVDGVPEAAQTRPSFDRDKGKGRGKPPFDRDKSFGKGPGKPPRKPKGPAGDAPRPDRRPEERPAKPEHAKPPRAEKPAPKSPPRPSGTLVVKPARPAGAKAVWGRPGKEAGGKGAPRSNAKSDAKPGFKGKAGKPKGKPGEPGPKGGGHPPRRKG